MLVGYKTALRGCQKSWLHRGWIQRATEHCVSQKLEKRLEVFTRKRCALSEETGRFSLVTKASGNEPPPVAVKTHHVVFYVSVYKLINGLENIQEVAGERGGEEGRRKREQRGRERGESKGDDGKEEERRRRQEREREQASA